MLTRNVPEHVATVSCSNTQQCGRVLQTQKRGQHLGGAQAEAAATIFMYLQHMHKLLLHFCKNPIQVIALTGSVCGGLVEKGSKTGECRQKPEDS